MSQVVSRRRKLGHLNIEIFLEETTGGIDAKYKTLLCGSLKEMQSAMSEEEKKIAVKMRSEVLRAAASFFVYINDPDKSLEVFKESEK